MYIQEYAFLKCKCANSKMHVQNTVNQLYHYTLTYIIASRVWYITWYYDNNVRLIYCCDFKLNNYL